MSRSKTFRPHLECLEDRSLLDAGFGRVLHPVPRTGPALVASAAPRGQAGIHDTTAVLNQAYSFLKDTIIGDGRFNGRLSNRWMLSHSNLSQFSLAEFEKGNQIAVQYRVQYGFPGAKPDYCRVLLYFVSKMQGGDKVYTLRSAGMVEYNGLGGDAFEGRAKELFQERYPNGIRINKFNQNAFARNVLERVQHMEGLHDAVTNTEAYRQGALRTCCDLASVTGTDGGLRVVINLSTTAVGPQLPYHQLVLNFKVDGSLVDSGRLTLVRHEVREPNSPKPIPSERLARCLEGVSKWALGADTEMGAWKRFGADVLQWFRKQGVSEDSRFTTGPTTARVESLQLTPHGVRVTLSLQRDAFYRPENGINPTLGQRVTLVMRSEGEVNGQHQLKLVDLQTIDQTDWKGQPRGSVGLEAFGTSAAKVKAAFAQVRV